METPDTVKADAGAPLPLSPELAAAAAAIENPAAAAAADTAAAGDRAQLAPAALDGAMGVCVIVVNALAGIVAQAYPETAYTPEEKTAAAAVLAPLFLKYGIDAAWMEKWREEIAAGLTIGGLAWTGYGRVKAARAPAAAPPA